MKQGGGSDSGEHERLGRFSLIRVIGRGASAIVYEAMDTRMGRPVALKVLFFDPVLPPEQRQRQIERFEREARAVARLSHPNIVSVFDVGEEDGKHFLVMELLSGVTLREWIEHGGPIAFGEVSSLVEQIASALDYTHTEGIVHRDIKPSNVLLLPDGRVKMLDFGIARHGEDATVTHTGMLIGSPAYMSPEQGRGENASPASDIWALGALLYEMLTGHSPFAAANVAAVLYKAAYDKPEPLPEEVSAAQPIVDTALAKRPEDRYASAGALANALRDALKSPVPILTATSPPRNVPLKNAASSAFVTSATTEGTTKAVHRPRSRLADFGVVAAWGVVVVAALSLVTIIVTVRMRQSSGAAVVPAAGAKPFGSRASVLASPPALKMTPVNPSGPVPSSSPSVSSVQIVETKTRVVLAPTIQPPATPSPAAIVTKPKAVAKGIASPPTPVASAAPIAAKPRKTAAVAAIELPWDDRTDHLGPEEPMPEKSTPLPAPPDTAADSRADSSSEQPAFKPSALLGRWQGNIGKHPATLTVQSNDGDSFQGFITLKTDGEQRRFSVNGSFSPVTGRVSFWSSETAPNPGKPALDLGQESGRLISQKTMGGIGLDSKRMVFTWSFSR